MRDGGTGNGLDLLALEVFEDVSLEQTWSAEKSIFRFGHAFTTDKASFNERHRANEVGDLKKFVILRLDALGKLDLVANICRKRLVQKIRDGSLPTVVVNFDPVELMHLRFAGGEKGRKIRLEIRDNLKSR